MTDLDMQSRYEQVKNIKSDDDSVIWLEDLADQGTVESTLNERGANYGAFSGVSELSQALKGTMQSRASFHNMTRAQKEALEMIQHKVARIINGDPNYSDSWHDIAGYATLVAKINNGENP